MQLIIDNLYLRFFHTVPYSKSNKWIKCDEKNALFCIQNANKNR